jgi:hypothetical protein
LKNAKECLIGSARQIAIANIRSFRKKMAALRIPTLLIWGKEDNIIDLEDAFLFYHNLSKAKLKIIPKCGHSPQEEKPEKTAEIISKFLRIKIKKQEILNPEEVEKEKVQQPISIPDFCNHKLKMRRLIDHWTPGTITIMVLIKWLQFLKKISFKAKEDGWRKASGIFLRKEHTNFILATFRLHYLDKARFSPDVKTSKEILIKRLAEFLHKIPACHWTDEAAFFMHKRKKLFFTDITEVKFTANGRILKLIPHFDKNHPAFNGLNTKMMEKTLNQLIFYCNKTCGIKNLKRFRKIHKKLFMWVMLQYHLSRSAQQELGLFVNRIMNSTFIQFDVLTDDYETMLKERLATPSTQYGGHPGGSLLNICCRFTNDLSEADLWFQYHHVPNNGTFVQEMLQKLKNEWGSCGQIKYPALSTPAAEMELYDLGHNIYRARTYICLDNFMNFRKKINEKYYSQMGGPATITSMLIWGLSQHEDLRNRKFLFPVDTSLLVDYPQERSISLVIIRPGKFFDPNKPDKGFIEYQIEFNRHLFATRLGKSKTYELLELYALIHPLFYYFGGKLMPQVMGKLIGTAGVTVLRDSEMFISPMTDVYFNEFIAIGNMKMATEDGKNACAISFCGNKERVIQYAEAIQNLCKYCEEILNESTEALDKIKL